MRQYTYTDADFEEFRTNINYWLTRFKVTGWSIEIEHEQIGEGTVAQCSYSVQSKNACFRLTKSAEGDYGFKRGKTLALHEVLHLILADLVYSAASTQDIHSPIVIGREHEVINHFILGVLDADDF